MSSTIPVINGHGPATGTTNGANGTTNNFTVKAGLAQMLKGGVIMDVINAEQVRFSLLPPSQWRGSFLRNKCSRISPRRA